MIVSKSPTSLVLLGILAVGLSSLTMACAGQTDDETTTEGALLPHGGDPEGEPVFPEPAVPKVTAGKFKLYDKANADVNPQCDLYAALDITSQGATGNAHIENSVAGPCAATVRIDGDPRDYAVSASNGVCGTKIYNATAGSRSVKIFDYRLATCVDVASAIVVEETVEGKLTTFYAKTGPVVPTPPKDECNAGSSRQFCWGRWSCVPLGAMC
jgi:hypothetical protein